MTAINDDWKEDLVDAMNDICKEHNPSTKQIVTALFTLLSITFRRCELSPENVKDFYLSAAKIYADQIADNKVED